LLEDSQGHFRSTPQLAFEGVRTNSEYVAGRRASAPPVGLITTFESVAYILLSTTKKSDRIDYRK